MSLVRNLIYLFHVMKASENLLVMAASQASGDLREYFERHLEEERGHAQWLAEDLETIGIVAARTQLPREAMEMVGSVYYLIFHADPVALLGYMSVLESWPLPEERLQEWERQYSVSLLRTVRYHAKHDPQHLAELQAVIAALPEERRALVDQTSVMTHEFLRRSAAYLTAG
jgi:rubrerythrin